MDQKLAKDDPEKLSGESSSDDDEELSKEMIQKMLQLKIHSGKSGPCKEVPKVLTELSVEGIVEYIKCGKASKVITMAGAGISTSAGIPDFRSPGTGLYSNLEKYNLPDPHSIFEIDYFRENPEPFFQLAKELYPDERKFRPTPSHHFVRLLHDKGILLRHYTQNIDTLERLAGLPEEKLIEAHGTFHTAHCIDPKCREEYSQQWVKDKIFVEDVTPTCDRCNAVVKPDIVFFGEGLPDKFYEHASTDFKDCDLLIVMGTSLTVQPFASLVDRVGDSCPRLLLNLEKCGSVGSDYVSLLLGVKTGFDFDSPDAYRDVVMLGKTDDSCRQLIRLLGWEDEFNSLQSVPKQPHERRTEE